jgi:hypothetical protein
MNKFKLALLTLIVVVSSCDVVNNLSSMYNFTKCDFRLSTVDNIRLAGVNVQNVTNFSNLSIMDVARITSAYASNQIPLSFNLNVEVKNPNKEKAVMNGMEWIVLIDNIEMTRGQVSNRIEVMPNNQTAIMPLTLSFDLKKVLTGKSADAVANFGMNLAGSGNRPSRITLKAKPSVVVGGVTFPYPDYITIQNDFGK